MALRASYYGVKRNLKDELKQLDGIIPAGASVSDKLALHSEVADVYDVLGQSGALNIFDPAAVIATGYATATSTDSGANIRVVSTQPHTNCYVRWQIKVKPGRKYKVTTYADITSGDGQINVKKGSDGTTIGSSEAITEDGNLSYTFSSGEETSILISLFITGSTAASGDVTFKNTMVLPESAEVDDFIPFASSNYDLAASASDQKTAINAIIAAASAESYAAFAEALQAITPVTRTVAASDTRSIPEEDPEPEAEVKTTKRTTKKTVKEGE